MGQFTTQTGFGVIRDSGGRTRHKYELQPGSSHELADGLTAEDVPDKAALDAIEVYKEPPDPAIEAQRQINREIDRAARRLAIAQAKADGKLNSDYVDPFVGTVGARGIV